MSTENKTPEPEPEITDEEALEWLNRHCLSIKIGNATRDYVGSWQVKGDILESARTAIKRLKEGEKEREQLQAPIETNPQNR